MREMIPPLLNERLDTAVRFGNILVPARSIETYMGSSCMIIYCHQDCEYYPVDQAGSGTCVTVYGRQFTLCTRHQLRNRDANIEKISIPVSIHGDLATSSQASWRKSLTDETMSDLEHDDAWVFDFTDSVANHLNMRRNFPNAKTGLSGLKEEAIVCFLAFGFGTQENLPLIEDGRITRLDTVFRSILCEDFLRTNDPNLLKIIPTTPLAFEPNGLSGGPVYAIVREGMGHTARLAGVITRAGKSSIHFLKFEAYLPLLKLMRNK